MKCFGYFILFVPLVIFSVSLFAEKESVYCLHGFMRRAASMKHMAKPFQKHGYETHLWDYPSREQTIEEHAEALVHELKKTAKRNPGKSMHFVTHSLGGIILRAAVNHPDCPEEAKNGRAVLLSPPNQGSSFGHFLNKIGPIRKYLGTKTGKQLLTTHNFDHLGQFPESMEVLVISGTFGWNPTTEGKNDGKIAVAESCLVTPHKHITVFAGHSWIMTSRSVIDTTLGFIAHAKGHSQTPKSNSFGRMVRTND
ncbi:MAG: hypothetical protein KR126chlam1_00699 [Chlamydiae bacterium]|nr:hypothetical protein [Chlamydiota bacterium]